MQLHLTEVLPSHQRGQGQLSTDSPHPDRAESCEPLPLHSSKRQQLQPALRGHTHTDCAAPRLFSLGQKCQELEKLEVFFKSSCGRICSGYRASVLAYAWLSITGNSEVWTAKECINKPSLSVSPPPHCSYTN